MNSREEIAAAPPTIISFTRDLPNLCSLAGLLAATLAIYFAVIGNFPAAMIGLVWALCFDWYDGVIARHIKGRTESHKKFGGQLDSLIDIISFAICPAIVLLSYSDFSPWYLPGAFLIVAAGALRLSYFNVFGMVDESTYVGMAIDNNGMLLVLFFVSEQFLAPAVFSILIYIFVVSMALLNVAPIRTPKLVGGWYYVMPFYVFSLTLIFAWQLI